MYTYEEDNCPVCGDSLKKDGSCPNCADNSASGTRSITIHRNGYIISQASNHHVSVREETSGRLLFHAQCTRRMTPTELERYWREIQEIRAGGR